jgi:chromosome segregation ATPase
MQEKNFYLETEADNLRKRVNIYEMDNKNKDKAGHGLEQTVYELESSLERVKSERNKALLERDEAYAHIERLEKEIKERKLIESELIQTKARDDSLNEYVEKLERENYKLRDQIDSYRRSEERLKSDNLELSAEVKKLQDYNSKISNRIDETRQVIESECHKRFSHIKEEDSLRILMLEKRLQSLENEKDNLLMELESRPTHKQVKENLRRISELEDLLKAQPPSSHSPILTSHISREKMRKDRELHSLTTGRLPSHSTLRRLLRDLMEELQVENVGDLVQAVQKLKCSGSVLKLYERLKELMMELSPEGRVEVMKPKHVWKWVRNLTEKYMELKKF